MNRNTIDLTNKKIAEEYANKLWKDKDVSVIDELVHHDVLIHSVLGDLSRHATFI